MSGRSSAVLFGHTQTQKLAPEIRNQLNRYASLGGHSLPRRLRPNWAVSDSFAAALRDLRVHTRTASHGAECVPFPCYEIYDYWRVAGSPLSGLTMDEAVHLAADMYFEERRPYEAAARSRGLFTNTATLEQWGDEFEIGVAAKNR